MTSSHAAHRVKIQGLLLDPPDGADPYVVSVYVDEDFELFYRNPKVRVKCTVPNCDTLLSAKQMRKSGHRFFAIRTGYCTHNEVPLQTQADDVSIDAAPPLGGGGLESDEHTWVKSRFFRICRTLGVESIIEDQATHADVYVPSIKLALEYQRWNTNFIGRTQARATAGAQTLWMFPAHSKGAARSKKLAAFNKQVYERGGLYLSVVDNRDRRHDLRPWEDSRLNKHARLYVSGSVAVYDKENGCLKAGQRSLAVFLGQVIDGTRTLTPADIRERSGRVRRKLVWLEQSDLVALEQTKASTKAETTAPASGVEEPKRRPATTHLAEVELEQLSADTAGEVGPDNRGVTTPTADSDPPIKRSDRSETAQEADLHPESGSASESASPWQSLWHRIRRMMLGR